MRILFLGSLLLMVSGCGDSGPKDSVYKLVPVSGTVTFDGKPAVGAFISFKPTGTTNGNGASAAVDAVGKFKITNPNGKEGIPVGSYVVLVSRIVLAEGSPAPGSPGFIPNAGAETMPPLWSDISKAGDHNTITIPDIGNTKLEFAITK